MSETFVTRFAPSPTGYLHIGHAYSALTAWRLACRHDGRFILRIEDIDIGRCRPEYTTAIYEDLEWLGMTWELPVRIQSEQFADYEATLNRLEDMDLLYPCFCTRREIQEELERSPAAPHGPEGPPYPGTCRALDEDQRAARRKAGEPFALRIDCQHAMDQLKTRGRWPLVWQEEEQGTINATPELLGDVVLARKDTPASYHLSVVTDDALQGITHVIRGQDLYFTTHMHRLLQALLDYPAPRYHHHRLLTDAQGKRFAKRDRATTIRSLREAGQTADDIIQNLESEWGLPRLG